MSLDPNEPTNQRGVHELPYYIRENRGAINSSSGSGDVGSTAVTIPVASTSLTVGTDLGIYGYETVVLTGSGLSTLTKITGGTEGQVKVIIFQDANVKLLDSISKADGTFYLHQLPVGINFEPQPLDVLALANIGGDGAYVGGYWKELYRTLSLK